MGKKTPALIAAVTGIFLAVGVGGQFSSEDSHTNTSPSGICEEFGFRDNGDPTAITINAGDTVSAKVIVPLADQLGTSMDTAGRMVKKANPGMYNIDEVGVGAVINQPNCAKPESHG